MRIVVISRPGGPEVLEVAEHPTPQPKAAEVLIRVVAAGVNRADVLQRSGRYPPPAGAPAWPGLEVSGIVESVGPGVHEFAAGDAVCALLAGGGYADFCVAPVEQTLPVPAGLDLVQAAALPESCFTVWSTVFATGGLQPGETLLVHGGSSGIGVMAIQLAAARGSDVYATAGSAEKCRACEKLGAIRAVQYRDEDFVAGVLEATQGHGVDVVLDMVAGDYIQRDLECLAEDGRIVVIATQGGSHASVDLARLMRKRATLTGSTLRPRPVAFKGHIRKAVLENVWPLLADGTIKPVVDRTFQLSAAADAHRRIESGAHIGKIVLTC